jgi:hypothetical protein
MPELPLHLVALFFSFHQRNPPEWSLELLGIDEKSCQDEETWSAAIESNQSHSRFSDSHAAFITRPTSFLYAPLLVHSIPKHIVKHIFLKAVDHILL